MKAIANCEMREAIRALNVRGRHEAGAGCAQEACNIQNHHASCPCLALS